MFQYTTETIINSNKGNLVTADGEGARFGILSAAGDNTGVKSSAASKEDFFIVDGVNTFKVKNITAIYHSPYRQDKKAKAVVAVSDLKTPQTGDLIRLTVTLSELGNVRSTIQNAYLHHTKPFHYEIISTGNNATDIAALADLIKKDMTMTDFKYFKAVATTNDLTFIADDCYIQFDEVSIVRVEPAANGATAFGGYARELTTDLFNAGKKATITPGDQGAGTVARIVKDLRIPTNASINPFGADHGGRPIPGGKYDQFLIEYTTERRHVAGTVVGSVDRSLTSHVFFVESSVKDDFEAILDSIASMNSIALLHGGRGTEDGTNVLTAHNNESVAQTVATSKKTPAVSLIEKTEMGSVE